MQIAAMPMIVSLPATLMLGQIPDIMREVPTPSAGPMKNIHQGQRLADCAFDCSLIHGGYGSVVVSAS